jgi:hypothetical protein
MSFMNFSLLFIYNGNYLLLVLRKNKLCHKRHAYVHVMYSFAFNMELPLTQKQREKVP